VIALAIYFCIADFVLITQCLYYNRINAKRNRQDSVTSTIPEEEPLLTRRSSDTTGLPGSHRRRSSAVSGRNDTLSKILEEGEENDVSHWKKNVLSILGVIAVGTAGWAMAWQSGVWMPTPEEGVGSGAPKAVQMAAGAQILGYISAVCYLGSVFTIPRCQYLHPVNSSLVHVFRRLSKITRKSPAVVSRSCSSCSH
jgi:hypothetical protein